MSVEMGRRIRELRQSYNMSIDELAEILGVSSGFLGLIERGKRSMIIPRIIKLSDIFRVSLDYLLVGRGTPPNRKSENHAAILESVLNERELQMIAELAKKISLYNYTEKEINMIGEALNFQMAFINSIKAVNTPHDE